MKVERRISFSFDSADATVIDSQSPQNIPNIWVHQPDTKKTQFCNFKSIYL